MLVASLTSRKQTTTYIPQEIKCPFNLVPSYGHFNETQNEIKVHRNALNSTFLFFFSLFLCDVFFFLLLFL